MSCSANLQSYLLAFAAGANGTLTGTASQSVNYQATTTEVSAVAAPGYHFVNWTGTVGFVTTNANPLSVSSVTAAQNITANFAPDPVDGLCGSSNNGIFATVPADNLCAAGTASELTGGGTGTGVASAITRARRSVVAQAST